MLTLKSKVLPVVVGAAVIVGGANLTAYAANGHAFLLGSHNHASKTTSLAKSGKGPALSLHTSKKSPPFAVNSSKKVKHLNAATVGGLDGKVLAHAYRYVIPPSTALPLDLRLNNLPKGRYAVSLNIATSGTGTPYTPFCGVSDSVTEFAVFSYGVSSGTVAINTGNGIATVTKSGDAHVQCDGTGGTDTYNTGGSKNVVILTPLAKVTDGTAVALARSPHSRFTR